MLRTYYSLITYDLDSNSDYEALKKQLQKMGFKRLITNTTWEFSGEAETARAMNRNVKNKFDYAVERVDEKHNIKVKAVYIQSSIARIQS